MLRTRKLGHTSLALTTIGFVCVFLAGCSKPLYLWQADLTSTARPPTFDDQSLANERVAILPLATYNHLQGYVPSVSQAFSAACTEVSPPVKALSYYETVNKLSVQGLSSDFVEEKPDYVPSRILDRGRLQRLSKGLEAKYVLQPGLAEFTESLEDRF